MEWVGLIVIGNVRVRSVWFSIYVGLYGFMCGWLSVCMYIGFRVGLGKVTIVCVCVCVCVP